MLVVALLQSKLNHPDYHPNLAPLELFYPDAIADESQKDHLVPIRKMTLSRMTIDLGGIYSLCYAETISITDQSSYVLHTNRSLNDQY